MPTLFRTAADAARERKMARERAKLAAMTFHERKAYRIAKRATRTEDTTDGL